MAALSKTWLTDAHIDLEYKSYLLKAYAQYVQQNFHTLHVYPVYPELQEHYRQAILIQEAAKTGRDAWPREISGMDAENYLWKFESKVKSDALFDEVLETARHAVPVFEKILAEGKEIVKYIASSIHYKPVGILPFNKEEGYILLTNYEASQTHAYMYRLSLYTESSHANRLLKTTYIDTYPVSLQYTWEYIKSDLLAKNRNLCNPATFGFETSLKAPVSDCIMPVITHLLAQKIHAAEP